MKESEEEQRWTGLAESLWLASMHSERDVDV